MLRRYSVGLFGRGSAHRKVLAYTERTFTLLCRLSATPFFALLYKKTTENSVALRRHKSSEVRSVQCTGMLKHSITNKIRADRHPCHELSDSGRRQFIPYTAKPLQSADGCYGTWNFMTGLFFIRLTSINLSRLTPCHKLICLNVCYLWFNWVALIWFGFLWLV